MKFNFGDMPVDALKKKTYTSSWFRLRGEEVCGRIVLAAHAPHRVRGVEGMHARRLRAEEWMQRGYE